ncbi:MAG TPA: hypothetical protein VGL58_12510 [Caulobacteraceae bacterium]
MAFWAVDTSTRPKRGIERRESAPVAHPVPTHRLPDEAYAHPWSHDMPQHPEVNTSLVRSRPAAMATVLNRPTVLGVVETSPAGPRARQLFEEARLTSLEHLRALDLAIVTVRDLSMEIVRGGDLYAPGLRELARNLAEDLFWKARTLELLSQRQSERKPALA